MGNALDTDNESNPAWRLFHIPYRVKIPEIYFHDQSWVTTFGRPTSGNKVVDKQLLNGTRTVWWTVDNMAEIFSMGSSIVFIYYDTDPVLIYTDIQNHLQDWNRYIQYFDQGLNKVQSGIPIEDLIKFSAFADALFPLTKGVDYNNVKPGTLLNKRTFSRRNRFVKQEEPVKKPEDNYQLDGSHVFIPGFIDNNPATVAVSKEERVEALRDSLKDKHHQSFTDIFESFMFSKMNIRSEEE